MQSGKLAVDEALTRVPNASEHTVYNPNTTSFKDMVQALAEMAGKQKSYEYVQEKLVNYPEMSRVKEGEWKMLVKLAGKVGMPVKDDELFWIVPWCAALEDM